MTKFHRTHGEIKMLMLEKKIFRICFWTILLSVTSVRISQNLFAIALLLTVVYRVCRCLDGKINKYIGKCVYIYTPAVIKKVSGFERPYIILQNDQGQNIKFFYNKSLSAELGNTVTIFAPYSSVFQESENVFVICSYFYSYISDYSNLNSN